MTNQDQALLRLGEALRAAQYQFTTLTPATHERVNARPENQRAKNLRDVFGWSRPFTDDVVPADMLAAMRDAGIIAEADGFLRSRVRVSSLSGELFFHSAFPTTEADAVFFGPDTYRFARAIKAGCANEPRRSTMQSTSAAAPGLAASSSRSMRRPRASSWPTSTKRALRLARVNAALAGTTNAIARRSDILSEVDGMFDLIVTNPPYLNDALGRAYRHGGGTFGGDLSLRILDAALTRLAPGGTLILYTGTAIVAGRDLFRDSALPRLAGREFTWTYEEVDPDVFGEELETEAYRAAERIAAVVLKVSKRS